MNMLILYSRTVYRDMVVSMLNHSKMYPQYSQEFHPKHLWIKLDRTRLEQKSENRHNVVL